MFKFEKFYIFFYEYNGVDLLGIDAKHCHVFVCLKNVRGIEIVFKIQKHKNPFLAICARIKFSNATKGRVQLKNLVVLTTKA